MAELPEDIGDQLRCAQGAAHTLCKQTSDLLALFQESALLKPLDKAHALLAISHAIQAMHHLHLRTQGHDPNVQDGVVKEDKRLQIYSKKVNKEAAAEIIRHSRPTFELNVAAANRFIEAAIPEQLTHEQKSALHAAGQKERKRKAEQAPQISTGQSKRSAKDAAVAFLVDLENARQNEALGHCPAAVVLPSDSAPDTDA